jgi:hypothetical protein
MKEWGAACVVLVLVPLSALLSAQWPAFPDRNAPRTADGKVNLEAPAPRTADGKPDFSGVWVNAWFYDGRVVPLPVSPPGEPPAATFGDVFANFKGELPLQPWAAQLKAARKEQRSKDNPDAHCLPMGLIQFHMHPQPRKVFQTPDAIAILYEGNAGVRQILTDGRPLPNNDPQPWWYGYSVGRWDGDTLVVETTNLNGKAWLNEVGEIQSHAARVIERFTPINGDRINYQATVSDPLVYTRPWTIALPINRQKEELLEVACHEDNQDLQHLKDIRDEARARAGRSNSTR